MIGTAGELCREGEREDCTRFICQDSPGAINGAAYPQSASCRSTREGESCRERIGDREACDGIGTVIGHCKRVGDRLALFQGFWAGLYDA